MSDGMIEISVRMPELFLASLIREAGEKIPIDKEKPIRKIELVGNRLNFYFNPGVRDLVISFNTGIGNYE